MSSRCITHPYYQHTQLTRLAVQLLRPLKDHTQILSAQGLAIAHIDRNYMLTRWTLSQVMARVLLPPSSDPEEAKLAQRLLDKLRYCKEGYSFQSVMRVPVQAVGVAAKMAVILAQSHQRQHH
jgi:hypothetical protein